MKQWSHDNLTWWNSKLETVKTISTPRKISTILLNIKANRSKLVNMCGYKLATNQPKLTEISSAWMKILHKVLGGYFMTHIYSARHNGKRQSRKTANNYTHTTATVYSLSVSNTCKFAANICAYMNTRIIWWQTAQSELGVVTLLTQLSSKLAKPSHGVTRQTSQRSTWVVDDCSICRCRFRRGRTLSGVFVVDWVIAAVAVLSKLQSFCCSTVSQEHRPSLFNTLMFNSAFSGYHRNTSRWSRDGPRAR